MWKTGISILQTTGCRGTGSWRWKRCDGMGRDAVLAGLVPAPSPPALFSQRVPPPSLPGCFPCTEAVSTFPTTRTEATTQTRGWEWERLRVHQANLILPD